jgi:putative sigma-54 modulation protein
LQKTSKSRDGFSVKQLRRQNLLFTITGKHIDITEAIRKYAEEKTSKLPRYYNVINQVEVIIDSEPGGNINVEIIARGEHSNVFIGTERGEDAYQCIDGAVHKLEGQLRRKKSKERDDKHPGDIERGTLV